jgi:SAC3 family protein LENG8/THP3
VGEGTTGVADFDRTTSKTWEHQDEFIAYRLLYYVFLGTNDKYDGGSSDMFHIMLSLSPTQRAHPAIHHALQVREAVAFSDYLWFFRLHKTGPNLGRFLTGLMVPTLRMRGLRRIVKAYRPSFELNVCLRQLGFESSGDEGDEEGRSWLISCGCVIDGSTVITQDSEVHEPAETKGSSLI